MTKRILVITMMAGMFFTACQNSQTQEKAKETKTETINAATTTTPKYETVVGKDGAKMEYTFDNAKKTATVVFNGETIVLAEQAAASGIWYENEHYELRGKGDEMELIKDDKVIFSNADEIVETSVKNKKGETLEMSFNNTKNTATLVFKGETIELKGEPSASGSVYSNADYKLVDWHGETTLTKGGKVVFAHKK